MSLFKLNSKIELIIDDEEKTFGLIQDSLDNKIYVSIPSDDKQFKLLRPGDKVKGLVYEDMEVIGFDAIITNRLIGDIPTYELSNLSNFSRVQRRDDVRVPCSLPLLYTGNKYLLNINIKEENVDKLLDKVSKYLENGIMSDLSAGGLKFTCEENFTIGNMLLFAFDLNGSTILTKGKVVYKELSIGKNRTIYIYGIKFIDILEEKREKIINYLFILMRKNRLK